MKQLFKTLVVFGICALFASCQENQLPEPNKEVSISLSYLFDGDRGNSMYGTKVTNKEVFQTFYEAMVDGTLIAPSYDLTFVGTENGHVYHFTGKWADNNVLTLLAGTYRITGTATASGDYIQEKCSLKFDQTEEIDVHTASVVLNAIYDCSLVVFSDISLETIKNNNGNNVETTLFVYNNCFYAFINNTLFDESHKNEAAFKGTHTSGKQFCIPTKNLVFEKGKYYVYADITLTYLLPYMEEGYSQPESGNYTAVDLGLSVRWASYNVGATIESEIGYRFAWGETIPDKDHYDWDNYAWYDQSSSSITKYYRGVDDKTKLDDEDDAAKATWGGSWRMPTVAEAQELFECTWTAETLNGCAGYRVTGPNSNSIFIPCNGQWDEGGLVRTSEVFLWTSECQGAKSAYRILNTENVACINHRHDGLCVRAVCE